ncbi:MAG: hypothetical protein M1501_04310 [Candidatus Omnitrophica bacterium]|nr:hypothetical protein [Candidatus Omnitrophota bacterium]
MKRFIIIGLLILIIGGISGFLIKKIFFPDDKQLIKKTIYTVVKSLEDKNIPKFMQQFSPDYTDSYGNTYGTLDFAVKYYLSQAGSISIKLSQIKIKIKNTPDGKRADVKFAAYATAWSGGSESEEAGRFELKLKKEYFKWEIYRFGGMKLNFQ